LCLFHDKIRREVISAFKIFPPHDHHQRKYQRGLTGLDPLEFPFWSSDASTKGPAASTNNIQLFFLVTLYGLLLAENHYCQNNFVAPTPKHQAFPKELL
jgi:hypothetical protein